jgi:sugar phosphate isomerase/epimerase
MSIVHFMVYPTTITGDGPIAATVSKIAEDSFFGAIEITHIDDPAERQKTRDVIEASHLRVGFGGQPLVLRGKLNLNSLDETERNTAVTALKAGIDEAAEIGAKRMAFLSGRDPGETDRGVAVKALIQSVTELCAYGRDKGVSLTCETFDRGIDKKALIGPRDLAAEFAAAVRVDFPDFGVMYDLSHQPLLNEKPEPALTLLKDHLVHVHVGNCVVDPAVPGYGDLHPRFGWPGGCNDVDELADFIRALFKIGYLSDGSDERPWIGFEVKPQSEGERSEHVVAGAKRVWQEAWSRV